MKWLFWKIRSLHRRWELNRIWKQIKHESDKQNIAPLRMAKWDAMEEYWFHKRERCGAALFIENSGLERKLGKEKAQALRNEWNELDLSYHILLNSTP